jgi:glycine C-acetyltransferase
MPYSKLSEVLSQKLKDMQDRGALKGKEMVVCGIKTAKDGHGPRFLIEGFGDREFLRMNSNSYLGMSSRDEIIKSEESAAMEFGTGPGAVRFISGTYRPHIELEKRLAEFHGREAAMIFSSAYATMMGTLASLVDSETIIISDELNHNCIINGIRLSRPKIKELYKHLNMQELEAKLKDNIGKGKRVLVITDGIFSMRGDFAPLDVISQIAKKYDNEYEEGVITLVDDSHGVGAFGKTGRGTEEYTNAKGIDIIVATCRQGRARKPRAAALRWWWTAMAPMPNAFWTPSKPRPKHRRPCFSS